MASSDFPEKASIIAQQSSDTGGAYIPPEQRYRIVNEIDPSDPGSGGNVYRAVDTVLNREVALKILNSDIEEEWKMLRGLNHPSIVKLYDKGRIADPRHPDTRKPFLAMELLKGSSLKKEIPKIRDWKVAVRIIEQCCHALAEAHEAGVLHCDIKPSNVMVKRLYTGHVSAVTVLDFGLAKNVTTDGVLATGGTYAYMSPEQISRQQLNEASDIFSLGIVSYELLTHHHPFTQDADKGSRELSAAISNGFPIFLREINPDVPERIALIIHKMLAKEINARPAAIDLISLLNEPEVFERERSEAELALREIRQSFEAGELEMASDQLRVLERQGLAFDGIVLLRHQIDSSQADRELESYLSKARQHLSQNDLRSAREALKSAQQVPSRRFDVRVLRVEAELKFREQEMTRSNELVGKARDSLRTEALRKAEWFQGLLRNLVDASPFGFTSPEIGEIDGLIKHMRQGHNSGVAFSPRGGEPAGEPSQPESASSTVSEALTLERNVQQYKRVLQTGLDLLDELDPDRRSEIAAELMAIRETQSNDVIAAVLELQHRKQLIIENLRKQLSACEQSGDIAGALEAVESLNKITPNVETSRKQSDLEASFSEALESDLLERLDENFACVAEIGEWNVAGRLLDRIRSTFPHAEVEVKVRKVEDQISTMPTREKHVEESLEHLRNYALKHAINELEAARDLDPDNAILAISLAQLLTGRTGK